MNAQPLNSPSPRQLQQQLVDAQDAYWRQVDTLDTLIRRIKRFEHRLITIEGLSPEDVAYMPGREELMLAIQTKEQLAQEIERLNRMLKQSMPEAVPHVDTRAKSRRVRRGFSALPTRMPQ